MNYRWKMAQAAEMKWWELYLKGKEPADYLDKKRQYWYQVLQELEFTFESGDTMLDAGCGPAGIFLVLENHEVDAVDPLVLQYQVKLLHFDEASYPWTNFYAQPLEQFQPPKRYDKVFCLNVINHVADLHACLDKLVHATKPGGDLLLTVDTHNYLFLKKVFQVLPGDVLHPHQFSLQDYLQKLEAFPCRVYKTQRLKAGFLFDYWAIWLKKQ